MNIMQGLFGAERAKNNISQRRKTVPDNMCHNEKRLAQRNISCGRLSMISEGGQNVMM